MRRKRENIVLWYMVMVMLVVGITPRAFAGFSPSEFIALSAGERSGDLKKVQAFLETKLIRGRLKDFGYSAEEIQSRLDQLSDQQIHQLAIKIDGLRTGGDGWGIALVAALIVVFILVIMYATGHRIVLK